jgi:hypothetical protein
MKERTHMKPPMHAHFNFLDALRQSGLVNMYESVKVLQEVYGMSHSDAVRTFSEWCELKEEKAREAIDG